MREISQNQAKGDSRLRLMIGVAPPRPGLCCVALGFMVSSDVPVAYLYSGGMRWPCWIFSAYRRLNHSLVPGSTAKGWVPEMWRPAACKPSTFGGLLLRSRIERTCRSRRISAALV